LAASDLRRLTRKITATTSNITVNTALTILATAAADILADSGFCGSKHSYHRPELN